MLENPLVSSVLAFLIVAMIAYITKLDMSDITGLARKSARKSMARIAQELDYELISARTPAAQGGLKKRLNKCTLQVDPDKSRIQVEFKTPLGVFLSSTKEHESRPKGWASFDFSHSRLNAYFHVRAGENLDRIKLSDIELALLPLIEMSNSRKCSHLYIKGEYLRVGFSYRNYLPKKFLDSYLPLLERTATALARL